MVIGRGRRREHPNQHFVLLLLRKKYGKKNTWKKSTRKKIYVKKVRKKPEKKVREKSEEKIRETNNRKKYGKRYGKKVRGKSRDFRWCHFQSRDSRCFRSIPVAPPQIWLCPYPYTTHMSSSLVFSGVRVTWYLVLCVCFVERCLTFWPFSFGHFVVCSSSIYGFWLPLWYLQTLLIIMGV